MTQNNQEREARKTLQPEDNKFHKGAKDGKHYWLTPPALMQEIKLRFNIDFDPCPYPKPEDFDGLTCEWGISSYVNPPFGAVMHQGKKKGATAWARKAIEENKKGKRVVLVHPIDKWVLMLLAAGAKVENLGDVRWCATEDGSVGKGTGRHIAMFILEPDALSPRPDVEKVAQYLCAALKGVDQEELDTIAEVWKDASNKDRKYWTQQAQCAIAAIGAPVDAWQPAETAPKSGIFDVWTGTHRVCNVMWYEPQQQFVEMPFTHEVKFTHWILRPEPPQQEAA